MAIAPDFSLQPLGYDQLDAVDQVMMRSFDPLYGEAWTRAQCLSLFALPGYQLRGILSPTAILAGFSVTRTVAGESELLLLAVDPNYRRTGLGSYLLHDWIDCCRLFNIERLFLEVRVGNPAIGLYEQCGFARLAVRPAYYRGADGLMRDAVTMQKLLD